MTTLKKLGALVIIIGLCTCGLWAGFGAEYVAVQHVNVTTTTCTIYISESSDLYHHVCHLQFTLGTPNFYGNKINCPNHVNNPVNNGDRITCYAIYNGDDWVAFLNSYEARCKGYSWYNGCSGLWILGFSGAICVFIIIYLIYYILKLRSPIVNEEIIPLI